MNNSFDKHNFQDTDRPYYGAAAKAIKKQIKRLVQELNELQPDKDISGYSVSGIPGWITCHIRYGGSRLLSAYEAEKIVKEKRRKSK